MTIRQDRFPITDTLRDWRAVAASVTPFTFNIPNCIRASTANDKFAVLPANQFPYLINGDFAAPEGWTTGAGWSIGSGVATAANSSAALTQTTADVRERSSGIVAGGQYLLTYTMTRTGGTLTPSLGGQAGAAQTTAGTKQEVITAGSSNANLVFTGTTFSGTVDDVSLYPLTPPLPVGQWEKMSIKAMAAVVQGTTIVTNSPAFIGWYDGP